MADKEELEKLFEAALHGKKPPSRFGTPEDQVIAAPVAFQKAGSVFQKAEDANSAQASPFQAASSDNQAANALDDPSLAALDENVNEEFEAIIDKKIAKEKARKRRDKMFFYAAVIAIFGGAGGWIYKNPEQRESIVKILGEMRTAMDPTKTAEKYDESLEKIGERGNALDDASAMLGVKKGEGDDDGSLDKEMQAMAGGEMGGLSAEEKKKKLDALKSKVPIKKKDDAETEEK